eukprot:g63219.t1
MLDIFWKNHNPCGSSSTQYKSVIFYQGEQQRQLAEETKQAFPRAKTQILPAKHWTDAEGYHQKYIAKARGTYKPEPGIVEADRAATDGGDCNVIAINISDNIEAISQLIKSCSFRELLFEIRDGSFYILIINISSTILRVGIGWLEFPYRDKSPNFDAVSTAAPTTTTLPFISSRSLSSRSAGSRCGTPSLAVTSLRNLISRRSSGVIGSLATTAFKFSLVNQYYTGFRRSWLCHSVTSTVTDLPAPD